MTPIEVDIGTTVIYLDGTRQMHSKGITWFCEPIGVAKKQAGPRQAVELKPAEKHTGAEPPEDSVAVQEQRVKLTVEKDARQAWEEASASKPEPGYVHQLMSRAKTTVKAEHYRACIKLQKYMQNYTKDNGRPEHAHPKSHVRSMDSIRGRQEKMQKNTGNEETMDASVGTQSPRHGQTHWLHPAQQI